MAPSTYSEVDTVSGEKRSTIGQIQVALSFNGRNFPCQFHVIENVTHNIVLGRDFLLMTDAIIDFGSGVVTLNKTNPTKLTLEETDDSRALASLRAQTSQSAADQSHYEKSTSFMRHYSSFIQRFKTVTSFILKFLIILLLMSPTGLTARANDNISAFPTNISPVFMENISVRSLYAYSDSSLPQIHKNQYLGIQFPFLLAPVHLKKPTIPSAITSATALNTLLQEKQVSLINHRIRHQDVPRRETRPD